VSALRHSDKLPIGLLVDGVLMRDFEMRPATVQDNIDATYEVGSANVVELSVAIYARQLTRLGTLSGDAINTKLLRGLHVADFNALERAAEELQKKLLSGWTTSSGGTAAEPPLPATASAPSTPPG